MTCKITISVFHVLALLLMCGCSSSGQADTSTPDLSEAGVVIASPDHSCAKYDIEMAPGGKSLIARYPDHGRAVLLPSEIADDYTVAVSDLDCALGISENCRPTHFYVKSPTIHNIYWDRSGDGLFVLNYDGVLFYLNVNGSAIANAKVVGKLPTSPVGKNSYAVSGPSLSGSPEAEFTRLSLAVSQLPKAAKFRKTSVNLRPQGVVSIGESANDLNLSISQGKSEVKMNGILAAHLGQDGRFLPTVLTSADGSNWLSGLGNTVEVSEAPLKLLPDYEDLISGSWPVVDAETGNVVGLFGEKKVIFFVDEGLKQIAKYIEKDARERSAFILDVSVSISSGRVAYSLRGVGQGVTVKVIDLKLGTTAVVSQCGVTQGSPVDVQMWNGGTLNWPLVTRLYKHPSPRGLIVYLHGGPARGSAFDTDWSRIRPLYESGYDIMTFDPSGSTGSAVTAVRLGRSPAEALETDAQLAAGQISKILPNYNEFSILAESFGGAWVHALYQYVPTKPKRNVLTAPLITYTAPKLRGANEYSVLFERYYLFGGQPDESFRNWLHNQLQKKMAASETIVIQGLNDDLSNPRDYPASLPYGHVKVTGSHVDALSRSLSLKIADCWLIQGCDAEAVERLVDGKTIVGFDRPVILQKSDKD